MIGTCDIIRHTSIEQIEYKNNASIEQLESIPEVVEELNEYEDVPPIKRSNSQGSTIFLDNTRRILLDSLDSHLKITKVQSEMLKQLSIDLEMTKKYLIDISLMVGDIKEIVSTKRQVQQPITSSLIERSRTPRVVENNSRAIQPIRKPIVQNKTSK